ncbi:hypothetical protein ACI3KY_07000 [Microbacterium sp. ZW T2_14]|uniref:hypothetical protein n=1 Tax=Microbacterium sp. ZW T2_14 TaxID=3378079 RepID=UPI003853CCBE
MTPIEIVRLSLVFAHIVGLAAVIGSYILQMPWKRGFDFLPLVIGSTVALVTGFALVAVREVSDLEVDRWKIVAKLAVALAVLALSVVGLVRSRRLQRRGADDGRLKPLLIGAGVLAMANVLIALFWR